MKKIFLLIALFYSISFCQGWNATVTTSINEGSFSQMDLFTNKDGNHLLIKNNNGNIMYYNLNSAGTVEANKTATLETGADFPNIVGSNNKIYALYKVGNLIKGKFSADGGTSWTALSDNTNPTSNECNGVDAVYDPNNGVHIVWATKDNNGTYFETYYNRLNTYDQWVEYAQVTDYGSEVGGLPTVTYSSNRVHVGYNTCDNTKAAKSRDRYNGTWQTPQEILSSNSIIERLHAGSNILFDFYYRNGGGTVNLYVKTRALNGSTWSSEYLLQTATDLTDFLSVANSADGKTHIVVYGANNTTIHKVYSDNGWSSDEVIASTGAYPRISITTNDLFVMWHKLSYNPRYLQYNATPAAPSAPSSGWNSNNYATVTWSANMEPDIASYKIYKNIDNTGWGYVGMVNYSLNTSSYSYVDADVTPGGRFDAKYYIYYKIMAKDIADKESNYSSTTSIYGRTDIWFEKQANGEGNQTEVKEYGLHQNYPNPFNPSTEINYQIPSKGFVTLKVYDALGNEVATLVNEWQEPGSYNAQFTTSGKLLASGMYFYTLTAGKFTDTKKFILMK